MATIRHLSVLLTAVLVIGFVQEARAVIYKYVDEKGDIRFVDDLQNIPAQQRSSAVMVSGTDASPDLSDAERAEAASRREEVHREQAAARRRDDDSLRTRLIISLSGAGVVAALLFVTGNIDALRERRRVLMNIRRGLVAGFLVLVVVVHLPDLLGLFRKAGSPTPGPFSDIQAQQEERGRKAGASIKAFNQMLDQAAREEEPLERRVDGEAKGR